MTTREDSALVSVDWLSARHHEKDLVIIDATVYHELENGTPRWIPGSGRFSEDGHIPGARFADLLGSFADPEAELALTAPAPARLAAALAALGITRESTVVVYDAEKMRWASRFWWLLTAIGHPDIRVLDGGRDAWVAASLPLEYTDTAWTPAEDYGAYEVHEVYASREQVQQVSEGGPTGQLVHALGRSSYLGNAADSVRSGHIRGAVHTPWEELLDDEGKLRRGPSATAILAGAATTSRPIVYCGSGISATLVLLSLHESGVRSGLLYDGSLTEWARYGGELVTGENPTGDTD